MNESMKRYEEVQVRLLELIRAGKYRTAECNALMVEAEKLWAGLSPEDQAEVEGRMLTDHELSGTATDAEIPAEIAWSPADATP